MESKSGELVCVTGANGLVAAYCVKLLLESGYKVRGTVRDPSDSKNDFLKTLVLSKAENLEIVKLEDICRKEDFEGVFDGCTYVMHVASKVEFNVGDEAINSAVKGTTYACEAALKAGVKRLVLTATMASVCGDQILRNPNHIWSEEDWNDNPGSFYSKGKTLGEKVAWDFTKEHPELELVTIHPACVFGPVYTSNVTSTAKMFALEMITGGAAKRQQIFAHKFGICDGRDVAEAHLKGMVVPEAKGQRYCVMNVPQYSGYFVWQTITKNFPPLKKLEEKSDTEFTPPTCRNPSGDSSKVVKLLGHPLIDAETSLIDTVASFIRLGVVKFTEEELQTLSAEIQAKCRA
jgi:nucleoside-diphosphate-sugar epimerase